MALIYPGGDEQQTPNLGLATWGMDEVVANNFIILDSAIGGGTSVLINSVSIANPNFNNTTPAAPVGHVNVIWQVSGSHVSGYVPIGGGSGTVTSVGTSGIATGGPITSTGTINVSGSGNTLVAVTDAGTVATATAGDIITTDGLGNAQDSGVLLSSFGTGPFVELNPTADQTITGDYNLFFSGTNKVTIDTNYLSAGVAIVSLGTGLPLASGEYSSFIDLPGSFQGMGVSDGTNAIVLCLAAGTPRLILSGGQPYIEFDTLTGGYASISFVGSTATSQMLLPLTSGTAGQVLTTDGNNPQQLSWSTPGSGSFVELNPTANQEISGAYGLDLTDPGSELSVAADAFQVSSSNFTYTGVGGAFFTDNCTNGIGITIQELGEGPVEILNLGGLDGILIQSSAGVSITELGPSAIAFVSTGGGFSFTDTSGGSFTVDVTGGISLTGSTTIPDNLTLGGTLTDGSASVGTSGQVLSSTGTGVLWTNAAGGGGFSTTGYGGFWGTGFPEGFEFGSSTQAAGPASNGFPTLYQFALESEWVISGVGFFSVSAFGGTYGCFGIYNAAGNLVLTSGPQSMAVSAAVNTTITPVTLPAGVYYLASGYSYSGCTVACFGGGTYMVQLAQVANGSSAPLKCAYGSSALGVNGALPATMGTLTDSTGNQPGVPAVFFSV
jgi:hypothetical protein